MNIPLALIIEDDDHLATMFAQALADAGYETEIAQAGDVALTRLAATTPNIVLLDLHLPRVSGEEILRQIRSDERLAKTRVMLATGDPRLAARLRKDADLVLLKPISYNQLHDLAERLLQSDTTKS